MPRKLSNRAQGEPDLIAGTAAGSNVPELSVSELSGALKRTVEERFGFVRLRGEVSNYRGPHSSGHAYFSLKDEGARIDAVVWRTAFAKLRIKPEEGMEVVATGKITTFPGKSSYQIVVETLEPAGVGALMAILEERRLRLAAEGLFDAARKKALPYLPGIIGVVTSPTGAVIRDILHRVSARFPRHVVVWPVRVQGETSGREVAAAIRGFNALEDGAAVGRPHLIIVARGGGSLEDLWGFNDEAVVRAVADSVIPLISAVGHETDWTLIDHAADHRAPTPTGAAEVALPVLGELEADAARLRLRQRAAIAQHLDRRWSELRGLARLLPAGADLVAHPHQRLDRATAQLPAVLRARHDRVRLDLARVAGRLGAQSPHARLARASQRLSDFRERLRRVHTSAPERARAALATTAARLATGFAARLTVFRSRLETNRTQVQALAFRLARVRPRIVEDRRQQVRRSVQLLDSLSYRGVLARGYAVVRDADGHSLRSAEAVAQAAALRIELADGIVDAVPGRTAREGAGRLPRVRRRDDAEAAPQPSLFDP